MANRLQVNKDGAWRDPSAFYCKTNGNWQEAKSAYLKVSGNWVEIFSKYATITVYGGIIETVTLTGTNGEGTYTVTTQAGGRAEPITVPVGTYNVTSNLVGYTQYSKQVRIDALTSVVTSYPDGALFWIGNGDSVNDTLYSKCGGFDTIQNVAGGLYFPRYSGTDLQFNQAFTVSSATTDTSWAAYFTFSGYNGSSNLYPWFNANIAMRNRINTSGYSTIKMIVNTEHSRTDYTGTYTRAFASNDLVPDADIYYNYSNYVACPPCFNLGIVSMGIDQYLSFCSGMIVQPYNSNTYNFQIWAVWLE